MRIYISHSRNFDFQNELYTPLKQSNLSKTHEFILPHQDSDKPFNTKELLQNKGCDMVLAEVSFPATGQGIELGWANVFEIPIVCIYKTGSKISGSLKVVCKDFLEYQSLPDLEYQLKTYFDSYEQPQN